MNHGNLLNDFSPPVNPPAEIEDVNDRKPEDWDEREKVSQISTTFDPYAFSGPLKKLVILK